MRKRYVDMMRVPFSYYGKKPEQPQEIPKKLPKGPVIFMALGNRNLNHHDFRHIVDVLRLHGKPKIDHWRHIWYRAHLVKGIRVNSAYDMEKYGLPRHEEVWFPMDHPIWQSKSTLSNTISQVIGYLPEFKVMDIRPVKQFEKYAKPELFTMMMNLEPGSPLWGKCERPWDSKYEGSIQVVRSDREYLELSEVVNVVEYTYSDMAAIESVVGRSEAKAKKVLFKLKWKYLIMRKAEEMANQPPDLLQKLREAEEASGGEESEVHSGTEGVQVAEAMDLDQDQVGEDTDITMPDLQEEQSFVQQALSVHQGMHSVVPENDLDMLRDLEQESGSDYAGDDEVGEVGQYDLTIISDTEDEVGEGCQDELIIISESEDED